MKYDGGEQEGIHSAQSNYGYIVEFLPPTTPFIIKKAQIFGMLVGSGWEGKEFTVSIWNKEGQSLYDVTYPVTGFEPNRPKWVVIDIPDIEITNLFTPFAKLRNKV